MYSFKLLFLSWVLLHRMWFVCFLSGHKPGQDNWIFDLMIVLEEKWGDPQSYSNLSCRNQECLHRISLQSIRKFISHTTTNVRGAAKSLGFIFWEEQISLQNGNPWANWQAGIGIHRAKIITPITLFKKLSCSFINPGHCQLTACSQFRNWDISVFKISLHLLYKPQSEDFLNGTIRGQQAVSWEKWI